MTAPWTLARTVSGTFFGELFNSNVLLNAKARRHFARGFRGPLSVKGVSCGEASWTVAGRAYVVDRASLLVVARDEPYDFCIESDAPVETFVVFFADETARGVSDASTRPIERLLDAPDPPTEVSLSLGRRLWTDEDGVKRTFEALRRCAGEPIEQGEMDTRLRRLLEGLSEAAGQVEAEQARIDAVRPETRRELYRRVLRAKAALDSSFDAPFDLGAIAREASLAPHHLHRTFRAVFHRTPFGYVVERRMAKAKRLLVEHDWDVVEVCVSVGYLSLQSFTRGFKRVTGVTPAVFRTRFRNGG